MDEIDSCWKQTERNVRKNGYREGAAAGRDSSFQTGFDEGYNEGYRIGRFLGQLEGKKKYSEICLQMHQIEGITEDRRREHCLICKKTEDTTGKAPLSDEVYQTSYEDIKLAQKSHNDQIEVEKKLCNIKPRSSEPAMTTSEVIMR